MKIVHATNNEVGGLINGIPGDQTKREVVKQDFFEYDWTWRFRPKNPTTADRLAKFAEQIAENDHVGYGQGSDRYTMYLEAKKLNWRFDLIEKPCATDCSQMMSCVCIACGMNVSPYMYTGNEYGCLNGTGEFDALPYEKGMDLRRGDILLTTVNGHTGIIVKGSFPNHIPQWVGEAYGMPFIPVYKDWSELSDRASWPTLAAGNLFDVCDEIDDWYFIRIAGEHFGYILKDYVLRKTPYARGITTSAVNVRTNPGAQYKRLGWIDGNEEVQICDVKKASNGADWYYIRWKDGFGFISAKYVKLK